MKKIVPILLFLFLCNACIKDLKRGDRINVSGSVIDTVKNKKLPNVKVYLVGCVNSIPYGIFCYNKDDSTVTDGDGNFSLTYSSNIKRRGYVLEISKDNNYSYNLHREYNFPNNGKDVILYTQELNLLRLNIKIDFNPYDTFYVIPEHGDYKQLIGRSIDTTILIKVLPNNTNMITYQIMSINKDSGAIYRRLRDTLQIGLTDITNYSKRITSTYQMSFF